LHNQSLDRTASKGAAIGSSEALPVSSTLANNNQIRRKIMDKQERGILLADQEELEKKIATIKKELFNMGTIWKNISLVITSNPENLIFSNAPEEFSDVPMNLLKAPSFNWREIPKIETMAELVQSLKADLSKLDEIQRKLHS